MRLTERDPTVHTPTNKQVNTQVYNRKGPHTVHTPKKINKQINTQVYNRKEPHTVHTPTKVNKIAKHTGILQKGTPHSPYTYKHTSLRVNPRGRLPGSLLLEPLLDDLVVVDFLPVLLSSLDVPVLVGGPLILHETSVPQNTGWLKQERERERERERGGRENRKNRERDKERQRERDCERQRERERKRETDISMKIW